MLVVLQVRHGITDIRIAAQVTTMELQQINRRRMTLRDLRDFLGLRWVWPGDHPYAQGRPSAQPAELRRL